MATHSNILAWRIPWTEEPGWLQCVGCKELYTTERLSTHIEIKQQSLIARDLEDGEGECWLTDTGFLLGVIKTGSGDSGYDRTIS